MAADGLIPVDRQVLAKASRYDVSRRFLAFDGYVTGQAGCNARASQSSRDLAAFYARLLCWPVTASEPARPGMPPEDGWAQLRPPAGEDGPTLNFEYEAKFTRPAWPAADADRTQPSTWTS